MYQRRWAMADSLAAVVLPRAGAGRRLRPLDRPPAQSAVPDRVPTRSSTAPWTRSARSPTTSRSTCTTIATPWSSTSPGGHPCTCRSRSRSRWGPPARRRTCARGWTDGRPWWSTPTPCTARISSAFVGGWDGERVRILMTGAPPFGPRSGIVASIAPAWAIDGLRAEPSGLWESLWPTRSRRVASITCVAVRPGHRLRHPRRLPAGQPVARGGASVIGDGAVVRGTVEALRGVARLGRRGRGAPGRRDPGGAVHRSGPLTDGVRASAGDGGRGDG